MKRSLFFLVALSLGAAAALYALTTSWGRGYRARLTELLAGCTRGACAREGRPGDLDSNEAIQAKIAETRRRLREELVTQPHAGDAA